MSIIASDRRKMAHELRGLASALAGKRVLITGASGMLPSYIVHALCGLNESVLADNPCQILALSRSRPNDATSRWVRWLVQDVCEPLPQDVAFDWAIHAASAAAPGKYLADPVGTLMANSVGLNNVLSAAVQHKAQGVLFFSSGEIYGTPPAHACPTPEGYLGVSDPNHPRGCYVEGKRFGEALAQAYGRQHGLEIKIVRPFQVFGPGLSLDDGRAFADFLGASASGQDIVLRSAGQALRSYCYIADATVAFLKVMIGGESGVVYNVGSSGPEVTIRALAERVAQLGERGSKVVFAGQISACGAGSPARTCPDVGRIEAELGWRPTTSLDEGLRRTLLWLREGESTPCRACGGPLTVSLMHYREPVPVAGCYVEIDSEEDDPCRPLEVVRCGDCGLVQLAQGMDTSFYEDYRFIGGVGTGYPAHLQAVTQWLGRTTHLGATQVVEVGASDGTLLDMLRQCGAQVVGFEPALEPAARARAKGLDVRSAALTPRMAAPLAEQADVIVIRHVLEHIDDIDTFMEGVNVLAHEHTRLVIEVPDLTSTVQRGLHTNFYHPHLSYFEIQTLERLLQRHGWRVDVASVVEIFGGSLLVGASRSESAPLRWAKPIGIACCNTSPRLLGEFFDGWNRRAEALRVFLDAQVQAGRVVDGYGAAERTVAALGYAGIDRRHLRRICDRNPLLHGWAVPGSRIPIESPQALQYAPPHLLVIFAVSYEAEIIHQLQGLLERGVAFVSLRDERPRIIDINVWRREQAA